MKILYVIDQNIKEGKTSGIIHKIKDKIESWPNHNTEVHLLSLYNFKLYNSQLRLLDDSQSFSLAKHGRYYTLMRLILSSFLLYRFLKRNHYDLMYIRQRPYMPFTKSCLNSVKTIVEINTNDIGEYKTISNVMYYINNLTRSLFYKSVKGFVCVTEELHKQYKESFQLPSTVIANGVNCERYNININIPKKTQLVFVGSPGFQWHGIEKVILLAEKMPECDFHLVGVEGNNDNNIFYHGYCSLDKTQEIVSKSNIGICSLSLYVKDMDEACPLKSRQYLAQGLPIIYAYKDTDLSGEEPFALRIPNEPNNIINSIEEIRAFVKKVSQDQNLRLQARKFAERTLDVKAKEEKRIHFLKEIYRQ